VVVCSQQPALHDPDNTVQGKRLEGQGVAAKVIGNPREDGGDVEASS
jgi:hypothetical protein